MFFREVLIEKYTKPSYMGDSIGFLDCTTYEWLNKEGFLHRENGLPAHIAFNKETGVVFETRWHKNGNIHRENDLPAVIRKEYKYLIGSGNNTAYYWYKNNKIFRQNDKPHCVDSSGSLYWLDEQERYHRNGGKPAVIKNDGTLMWMRHGIKFRSKFKPCVIYPDNSLEFLEDDIIMKVNMVDAMKHYAEQIRQDREKNGIFVGYNSIITH
jgi:hypothetical protein